MFSNLPSKRTFTLCFHLHVLHKPSNCTFTLGFPLHVLQYTLQSNFHTLFSPTCSPIYPPINLLHWVSSTCSPIHPPIALSHFNILFNLSSLVVSLRISRTIFSPQRCYKSNPFIMKRCLRPYILSIAPNYLSYR